MMRKRITYVLLLAAACLALSGCMKKEYEALSEEITELEIEVETLEEANDELKLEKKSLLSEIDEITSENRELFESTRLPYHYFDLTAEEYIEKILYLQNNPIELWINGDTITLLDELVFEKEKEDFDFVDKYTCEVFNFEETGEKCIAEIETLESDVIISIKFTYYFRDDGTNSDLGYQHYFNYTDMFLSAFIMLTRGSSVQDSEFDYYFDRFYNHGTYFEGNAWVRNYISEDGETVTFQVLPVGLKR